MKHLRSIALASAAALLATEAAAASAAPAAEAAETADPGKSIIDPKYRDKYKTQDWLGETVNGAVTLMTERAKKVPVEGEEGAFKEVTEQVADGVDVDKLFKLARENGLNVDKFEAQRNGQGFAGRFRMTVRNMLQAFAKRSHGITVNGKWVEAPADWLKSKDAPAEPTHSKAGEKIAKPKPTNTEDAKPADAPAEAPKSSGKPKDAAKK